jgi:CheY-like chemotaxis protein
MKGKCEILLIDDEADMRIALAELLEDEGYTVCQAKDGKKGLQFLQDNPKPKLILLDYMMPEMGGAEFCEKLRLNSQWASIPVALVSAATLSKEKRASMGLAAFIEKPIQIEKFLAIVEQYCKEN